MKISKKKKRKEIKSGFPRFFALAFYLSYVHLDSVHFIWNEPQSPSIDHLANDIRKGLIRTRNTRKNPLTPVGHLGIKKRIPLQKTTTQNQYPLISTRVQNLHDRVLRKEKNEILK